MIKIIGMNIRYFIREYNVANILSKRNYDIKDFLDYMNSNQKMIF